MKKIIISFFVIILIALNYASSAQISGTVFHDYNGNGIQNNTAATPTSVANIETGIPGVIIKAFSNADVLIASQITGVNGTYSFPVGNAVNQIPNATAVRLEYVLPQNCIANSNFEFSALGGITYGSNVQFKAQATTTVTANFGINNLAEYRGNNNNPKVIVPRHSNGNPIASPAGNSALEVALYSFNYTASGQSTTGNDARTSIATAAQIGTCWGIAYNKFNDRVYTAAFLKRHSGLGPGGPSGSPNATNAPGAIYVANPNATNSGSFFFSMDALGASYYSHDHVANNPLNVRDNVARGMDKDIDASSQDAAAFDQIGKVGIGDLEMSDDGRYMWLTNLYDRKLYRIDLTNPTNPVAPTAATAATLLTSWNLPALTCSNGVLRPFGLKFYKGNIYVGVVCTGETDVNANSNTNVNTNYDGTNVTGGSFNVGNAYVLQFNTAGAGVWNTILTIPLNYPRGNAADENFNITRWYNWTNNFDVVKFHPSNSNGALIHPQPVLANIEFDVDGTMMIGFMDRLGNQAGKFQNDINGIGSYFGEIGGDLLRAYNNGCAYQLESNGKEGASSSKPATSGANHGQGFGNGAFSAGAGSNSGNVNGVGYGTNYGEFYHNDRYWYPGGTYWAHNETSLGSLGFLPGSTEVISASLNPFDIFSNGVNRYSNITGDSVSRYEVIASAEAGTFAKANSLGDIEIITPLPAIEIGNRVWNDTNGNGIQDAGENGIGGVMLELYHPSSSTVIGNVTTSLDGSYYFTSAVGTDITGVDYGVNILPKTNYILRLATSGIGNDWDPTANSGAGSARVGSDLHGLLICPTAIVGAGAPNLSDNDAAIISGIPQVSITTGEYGQNNHNIDFGFKPSIILPIKIISFTAQPKSNQVQLQWEVTEQINVATYEAETSTDGRAFSKIATIPANNNTSEGYATIHPYPVTGLNYYRIKSIEKDGSSGYSEIRKVLFGKVDGVVIYPNPISTDLANLNLTYNMTGKTAVISILSMEGKLLSQRRISSTSQIETVDVSKLANGSYILKIVTGMKVINETIQVMKK
jgi:SdrD B-like domain/Secretion system C-terminal sorting domain